MQASDELESISKEFGCGWFEVPYWNLLGGTKKGYEENL